MKRVSALGCLIGVGASLIGCFNEGPVEGPPTVYDASREYYLPWDFGTHYGIVQGYHGVRGHQANHISSGEFAIDAVMDEGTLVLAARAGVVTGIEEGFNLSCHTGADAKDGTPCGNNFVTITHADGSYGEYLHIGFGGACVEMGDQVDRGDVIAYSGHVGISFLAHLHFHVGNTGTPPVAPAFADVDEGGTGVPRAGERTMPSYNSANTRGRDFCGERSVPVPPPAI